PHLIISVFTYMTDSEDAKLFKKAHLTSHSFEEMQLISSLSYSIWMVNNGAFRHLFTNPTGSPVDDNFVWIAFELTVLMTNTFNTKSISQCFRRSRARFIRIDNHHTFSIGSSGKSTSIGNSRPPMYLTG